MILVLLIEVILSYKFIIFILKLIMRAHRGKQLDWTKPFKLVDSKAIF
jgi:hypothetical protein